MTDTKDLTPLRALLVEDCESDAEFLLRELRRAKYAVTSQRVESGPALQAALRHQTWDIVFSDYNMPEFSGMAALAMVAASGLELPFILISGIVGEDTAVEIMRAGANDYFVKGRYARLGPAVARELRETAARRARRKAEEQVLQLSHAVQQAPVSLVITDVAGNIEDCNPKFTEVSGYSLDEVRGRNPRILKSGLTPESVYQELWREISAGREWRGELLNRKKSGELFWASTSISPIRSATGKITGFLAATLDITEKKLLEEKFLHAQRLESIGMLAAGIAHDLNNVLAPVMFAAPMLREHLTAPRDLKIVETIAQSAERGASLVKQIMGFVRTSAGDVQLTQVKHLLHDVAGIVEETFPKAIECQLHFSANLWPVRGNPTQIHQVLMNLCVNARDAMPQGGKLRLNAANCRLDATGVAAFAGAQPGDWLLLEVGDTGTGIPPEILESIWAPFFTTKPAHQGTGLGLATVRSIVLAHRGFIDVRTAPGQGTTFRIILPAIPDETTATPATSLAPCSAGGGELILLVDDEIGIREIAVAILQKHGYRAVGCTDGLDALKWLNTHDQDVSLVVTDVDMPRFGGIALARTLRQIRPNLPILGISGLSSPKNSQADIPTMESIADGFLHKPFSAQELLEAVSLLLNPLPAGQS